MSELQAEVARAYKAFAEGDYEDASARVARILQLAPREPGTLVLKARLLSLANEPESARDILQTLARQHPDNGAVLVDLSRAHRELGQHERARDLAQRGAQLNRNNVNAWVHLGEIELSLNQQDSAGVAFKKALAIQPHHAAAFRGWCESTSPSIESAPIQTMLQLTNHWPYTANELARVHYALSQVFRQHGRQDGFIHHLLEANRIQRTLTATGQAEFDAALDQQEEALNPSALASSKLAQPIKPTPIFVLGMPRSGTTLVEQLIAAHAEVTAAGEMNYMRGPLQRQLEQMTGCPFPKGFETLSQQQLNNLANNFAKRLRALSNHARWVTDKTPGNYHLLGLLIKLFPKGKIIHVTRDPMDTCFSILQHPFDDRSPHMCDMELLAHAYARYRRIMQYWQSQFPEHFLTVQYESLVDNPAGEGARIYRYCGLSWNDSYLDFHRSGNVVRTFSTQQVRKPVYRSSVGIWKQYAMALQSLRDSLDRELAAVST